MELQSKKELQDFLDSEWNAIQKIKSDLKNKEGELIDWCRTNRKDIKKLFPKKNEVLKIIETEELEVYEENWQTYRQRIGYEYGTYFKVTSTMFNPENQFRFWDRPQVMVKGDLLDDNLKVLRHEYEMPINNLTEITVDNSPSKAGMKLTKVYVMIDKNTGYYKIGRSVKPKVREKTLQSEKPTIELLFSHDARVKDEKELHNMFCDKRIRGEWFDLNGSDLNKVKEYFS